MPAQPIARAQKIRWLQQQLQLHREPMDLIPDFRKQFGDVELGIPHESNIRALIRDAWADLAALDGGHEKQAAKDTIVAALWLDKRSAARMGRYDWSIKALDQLARIHGIYAPTRVNVGDVADMSDDELAVAARELARSLVGEMPLDELEQLLGARRAREVSEPPPMLDNEIE